MPVNQARPVAKVPASVVRRAAPMASRWVMPATVDHVEQR